MKDRVALKLVLYFFPAIFYVGSLFSCCNSPNQGTIVVQNPDSAGGNSIVESIPPVTASDSAKYVSKNIEVKGAVENNLSLTVDSLKQMKTVVIDNYQIICQSATTGEEIKSCKGVLLRDIIDRAKIKQSRHKDRNFYIVARSTDNYKATFSWSELFNNPTGESTYVIFEENGKPIVNKGEMILICNNDIKTGPRHVIWLKSIEVNRVE